MKACFLLQRRFAFLGHEMVKLLKEQYGVDEFCAYVTTRSSYNFLTKQKEIEYTNLLLEEDVYNKYKNEEIDLQFLKDFKKEYGLPNLWPYVLLDRILRFNLLRRAYPSNTSEYSHEDLIKIFQVTAKAVLKFIEKEKPDFILFSIVGNLGSYLLYEIAKKKGIKTLLLFEPRVGNVQTISQRYKVHTYLKDTIEEMKNNKNNSVNIEYYKKAEDFLHSFQTKPFYYLKDSEAIDKFTADSSSVKHHFSFLRVDKIGKSIYWFFKSHIDYIRNVNKDRDDNSTIKPWVELWDKVVRKGRIIRGYKDLYNKVSEKDEYIYFALHSEPEALFPFSAPFFTDQQWLIEQIARSLPIHYKLYVKDHPCMIGLRPRDYYKRIKKIPNVKLIHPSTSSLDLIQKSKMVIAVTGTAAWEGVLLKKPAIVFGDVFYKALSMVERCNSVQKLPELIEYQLENFKYNDKELIDFIAGLYKESAPIDLAQIWDIDGAGQIDKKKRALGPLVELLASKVGLSR